MGNSRSRPSRPRGGRKVRGKRRSRGFRLSPVFVLILLVVVTIVVALFLLPRLAKRPLLVERPRLSEPGEDLPGPMIKEQPVGESDSSVSSTPIPPTPTAVRAQPAATATKVPPGALPKGLPPKKGTSSREENEPVDWGKVWDFVKRSARQIFPPLTREAELRARSVGDEGPLTEGVVTVLRYLLVRLPKHVLVAIVIALVILLLAGSGNKWFWIKRSSLIGLAVSFVVEMSNQLGFDFWGFVKKILRVITQARNSEEMLLVTSQQTMAEKLFTAGFIILLLVTIISILVYSGKKALDRTAGLREGVGRSASRVYSTVSGAISVGSVVGALVVAVVIAIAWLMLSSGGSKNPANWVAAGSLIVAVLGFWFTVDGYNEQLSETPFFGERGQIVSPVWVKFGGCLILFAIVLYGALVKQAPDLSFAGKGKTVVFVQGLLEIGAGPMKYFLVALGALVLAVLAKTRVGRSASGERTRTSRFSSSLRGSPPSRASTFSRYSPLEDTDDDVDDDEGYREELEELREDKAAGIISPREYYKRWNSLRRKYNE